jgi:hypothetical protein
MNDSSATIRTGPKQLLYPDNQLKIQDFHASD